MSAQKDSDNRRFKVASTKQEMRKIAMDPSRGFSVLIDAFTELLEDLANEMSDQYEDPIQAEILRGNAAGVRDIFDQEYPSKATTVFSKSKGTRVMLRGEENGQSTISDEKIRKFREEVKAGKSVSDLAPKFKISRAYAYAIARGEVRRSAGGPSTRKHKKRPRTLKASPEKQKQVASIRKFFKKERKAMVTLDDKQVVKLREWAAARPDVSVSALAREAAPKYGISESSAAAIIRGNQRKEVDGPTRREIKVIKRAAARAEG